MVLTLFLIPVVTLLMILCIWSYFNSALLMQQNKFPSIFYSFKGNIYRLFKLLTLVSFFTTLAYSVYIWKMYPANINGAETYASGVQLGNIYLFELSNNLSLPFIILSTFVLLVSLLTAWYSGVNMLLFCVLLLLLEICLVGAFSCTSLFLFLLFFEASALPIFILIAYCGSSRRERLKAGYYFLFYTFYGSLSLLLILLNFYSLNQVNFLVETPVQSSSLLSWTLLFIAFAVKIPLFPFHIWLPYAHVEASTPASIILAALMLKLGGYGLIKFMLPMFTPEVHKTLGYFAFVLCVVGSIYSSLAALRQVDLKRYVAFSSVAHMSFATAGIFTFTEIGLKGAVYLMLSHGLTSSAMFFLVGMLSDRYHTRAVTAFSGLLATMPVFSFFFIVVSLANAGFPGTSGFLPEIEVLLGITSASSNVVSADVLFVLFAMFLTTATTLLPMLRMLFGHSKNMQVNSNKIDATKLEFYILTLLTVFILVLGLYDILHTV